MTGKEPHIENSVIVPATGQAIPAFAIGSQPADVREQMTSAVNAWRLRTPSSHTQRGV